MAKILYTASIKYTDENMHKLSRAINNTFKFNLKLIYAVICIGLIIAGVLVGLDNVTGIVMTAFGCFLLPSINVMEKYQANQAIKNLHGVIFTVNYEFREDGFACFNTKERNEFSYETIIRMVKERDAYYLFPNAAQAYMLDKSSVKPAKEELFQEFLEKKTGLSFTLPNSFATLSLKKIRFDKANTRLKG